MEFCWNSRPVLLLLAFVRLKYLVGWRSSLLVEKLCGKEDGNISLEVHHHASRQPL